MFDLRKINVNSSRCLSYAMNIKEIKLVHSIRCLSYVMLKEIELVNSNRCLS